MTFSNLYSTYYGHPKKHYHNLCVPFCMCHHTRQPEALCHQPLT